MVGPVGPGCLYHTVQPNIQAVVKETLCSAGHGPFSPHVFTKPSFFTLAEQEMFTKTLRRLLSHWKFFSLRISVLSAFEANHQLGRLLNEKTTIFEPLLLLCTEEVVWFSA